MPNTLSTAPVTRDHHTSGLPAFAVLSALALAALAASGLTAGCAGDGVGSGTGGTIGSTGGTSSSGQGGSTASGQGGSTANGQGGSTASGQGGSTANGQGGSTANGQGGSTATGTAITTVGGYYTSGTLKGYFFTAADSGGSTIMPADYSVDGRICARGTAAMVMNMNYATTWGTMIGWNINQAQLPPNPPGTAALSGSFAITLSGTVPAGVRLKVSVGGMDYCTSLSSGANVIPVSSLVQACWQAGGAAYAGQPVEHVAVQVTTNPTAPTPFDFCIASLTYNGN